MRRPYFSMIALFLGLGLACSGGPNDLEPPPRHADVVAAEAPMDSVLVLPLTLSYGFLAETVGEAMPDPVYSLEAQKIAASIVADITVKEHGEITATPRGEALRFIIPVRVRVDAYRQKADGSKGASLGIGRAKMNLLVDMTFSISEDWALIADSNVRYRWIEEPTLDVGPVTLDVKDAVDRELKEQIPTIEAALEETIQASKSLRTMVRKAWRSFVIPRQISDNPLINAYFTPNTLTATDPQTEGAGLSVTLGASGPLQVWLGDNTPSLSHPILPKRQPPTSSSQLTRVILPLYIRWEDLAEQARPQLVGLEMTAPLPASAGDATVTITDLIDIYPSGDKLAVGVTASVTASGQTVSVTLWMLGKPALNKMTQTLSLEDFTFAAETDSTIANIAMDALYEKIRDAAQEHLVLSLDEHLTALQKQADDAFGGDHTVSDGLTLTASFDNISLTNVQILEEHLALTARVRGVLSVSASQ